MVFSVTLNAGAMADVGTERNRQSVTTFCCLGGSFLIASVMRLIISLRGNLPSKVVAAMSLSNSSLAKSTPVTPVWGWEALDFGLRPGACLLLILWSALLTNCARKLDRFNGLLMSFAISLL